MSRLSLPRHFRRALSSLGVTIVKVKREVCTNGKRGGKGVYKTKTLPLDTELWCDDAKAKVFQVRDPTTNKYGCGGLYHHELAAAVKAELLKTPAGRRRLNSWIVNVFNDQGASQSSPLPSPLAQLTRLIWLSSATGWKLLWTPPYEPDLQPIEMCWAQSKGTVAYEWIRGRGMERTYQDLRKAWWGGKSRNKRRWGSLPGKVKGEYAGFTADKARALVDKVIKRCNEKYIPADELLGGKIDGSGDTALKTRTRTGEDSFTAWTEVECKPSDPAWVKAWMRNTCIAPSDEGGFDIALGELMDAKDGPVEVDEDGVDTVGSWQVELAPKSMWGAGAFENRGDGGT